MQDELNAEGGTQEVLILGVNAAGLESGNAVAVAGKDLPWLQDTIAAAVWGLWDVEWRDVVILDGANRKVDTFNLTTYDLANPANYADLRARLRAAMAAR